jgi:hypothetical protein
MPLQRREALLSHRNRDFESLSFERIVARCDANPGEHLQWLNSLQTGQNVRSQQTASRATVMKTSFVQAPKSKESEAE